MTYIKMCAAFQNYLRSETKTTTTLFNEGQNFYDILYTQIDELIPTTTKSSEEHDCLILMHAYTTIACAEGKIKQLSTSQELVSVGSLLDKCIKSLRPLINDKNKAVKAFHATLLARIRKSSVVTRLKGIYEAMDALKDIDKFYETFTQRHSVDAAWDITKVFGFTKEAIENSDSSFKGYLSYRRLDWLLMEMWSSITSSYALKDPENTLKYGLRCLPIIFYQLKAENAENKVRYIHILGYMAMHLQENLRYKLANHLLGIAMQQCVKLLRNAPHLRVEIEQAQVSLCGTYTIMGEIIARMSLYYIQNKSSKLLPLLDKTMNDSNAEVLCETDLTEEAAVYLKHVPMELVTDIKELKKMVERTLGWAKRTVKLMKKPETDSFVTDVQQLLDCVVQNRPIEYPMRIATVIVRK